jgi:DNA gyrase/topoisomerase IV subunit A
MGVIALNLETGDNIEGIDCVNNNDQYIFVLSSGGTCKKCRLDHLDISERNTDPSKLINLNEGEKITLCTVLKGDEEYRVYTKNGTMELSIKDVPTLPRMSRGRKLLALGKGNYIIDIAKVK